MSAIADRVLVIFPFEKAIYEQAGVPVDWVGHPLLDVMPPPRAGAARCSAALGLDPAGRWSRCCRAAGATSCARSCRDLVRRRAARFASALPTCSSSSPARRTCRTMLFAPLTRARSGGRVSVDRAGRHVLAAADVAIVASGTVTVQAALHECPMVVVYRLSPLTYRLGSRSSASIRMRWPTSSPAAESCPS